MSTARAICGWISHSKFFYTSSNTNHSKNQDHRSRHTSQQQTQSSQQRSTRSTSLYIYLRFAWLQLIQVSHFLKSGTTTQCALYRLESQLRWENLLNHHYNNKNCRFWSQQESASRSCNRHVGWPVLFHRPTSQKVQDVGILCLRLKLIKVWSSW